MNASPSSPPLSPSTRSTAEVVVPTKRNLGFWRPVLSCGGALLTGAILINLMPATPATSPITPAMSPETAPMVLSASQLVTARTILQTPDGNTLRGQWNLATDVTGRAKASGEVARWVVEPGARVEAGDKVVEISTGAASRAAPFVESGQNSAEREQVAAANGQSALSQKLALAQQQLADAQDRVARAQAKVASTHILVRRLMAGEKIPGERATTRPKSRRVVADATPTTRLTREQQSAEDAASQAKVHAVAAKAEWDDAKKALTKAQKQVDSTTTKLSKAEADFKAEKTTADVLQAARTDADDAASELKAAQTRVDVAERAYASQQVKAATSEETVQSARVEARKSVAATPAKPTQEPERMEANSYMTADQAATLVDAALRESKVATREADRIHSRVDDYQRQVKQTSQRVESASKDLQTAQQE